MTQVPMNLQNIAIIVTWILIIASGAYSWGHFESNIDELQGRVTVIESRIEKDLERRTEQDVQIAKLETLVNTMLEVVKENTAQASKLNEKLTRLHMGIKK